MRSAVLRVAHRRDPNSIAIDSVSTVLDYAGGTYEFVESWQFLDKHLESRLTSRRPSLTVNFATAEEYFKHYGLRQKRPDGTDEHYAERLFVERSFIPVFGTHGLRFLTPQVPFVDSAGKQRRIDFVLQGRDRYALEVEGHHYHAREAIGKERFEDEKARQAELTVHGYKYVPFTLQSIGGDYAKAVLNDITVVDDVLMRLASAERKRREGSALADGDPTGLRDLELLICAFPEKYQTYQQLALSLLHQATCEGLRRVDIGDYEPELPLLTIALLDAVALVEHAAELYGFKVVLPEVNIHILGENVPTLHAEILDEYLCSGTTSGMGRIDGSRTPVMVTYHPQMPDTDFQYVSGAEAMSRLSAPPGSQRYEDVPRFVSTFLREMGTTPPLDLKPVRFDRPVLDYFARRYCPYAELKAEQVQLIQRALAGESVLGILPTGFGKSAVFQIFALLSPRVTLIISPLKSLMRDQLFALRRRGLKAAEAISSSSTPAEKIAALQGFASFKYKMLYLSPERLQIKGFVDELRASIENSPIGALVIDEAHCVSEWGHDFRPAYLQIAPLREVLQAANRHEIPLIALTATASSVVREDVVSMLGLEAESVIQLSSSDRPNLSLSVHVVPPDAALDTKDELITTLLEDRLPKTLGIPSDELIPVGRDAPYPHAGVIFSLYANPHGNTTINEGVHSIAKYLIDHVTFDPSLVEVHASTTPDVCPQCRSPLFVSASKARLREAFDNVDDFDLTAIKYLCLNPECKHVFYKPDKLPSWDETIAARQDAFQSNEFPLLVATKGYGMGVDKRNIRFVIHHALSGGLESYYQEAGRAGRDKKHSHVALVFRPPTEDCYTRHLRKNEAPPCVTDDQARKFHRCPMGLKGLCDAGRQSHFIASSYEGIELDLAVVTETYAKLTDSKPIETRKDSENNKTQLALYRLQQLGFIQGYTLKYNSLYSVTFEVVLPTELDRSAAEASLARFLTKTRASAEEVQAQLARLADIPWSRNADEGNAAFVEAAASIQLERVYAEVPRMRYAMLQNLLLYANSMRCRRVHIRSVFDNAPPGDDYQCGFCDVCNPSLVFDRDSAEVPTVDAQMEDLSKRLPEVLKAFDVSELPAIVDVAVSKGAVNGMFFRVASALEHDATNVSALYLSGALGRRVPELRERAMSNLEFGAEELRRQGKGREELLLVYEEGSSVDAKQAFSWLDSSERQFGDEEGLKILEHEAATKLGANSTEARMLHGLRQVRGLSDLEPDLGGLATGIEKLASGFSAMPQLRV